MSNRSTLLLEHHLKELKLPSFLREYGKMAAQCAAEGVDHPEYLLRLAELELIERHQRMVERRIRAARFPAVKSLDTFDFPAIPSVNKTLVSRVNYICRLASISFAGSPPRPGRVAGQRCRPPLVHVQVRAADTRGSDLHDAIVGVLQLRVWHIFRGDTEWGLVNNCFHNKPLLGLQGSSIVGLL